MDEFPSNSKSSTPQPDKNITSVISSTPIERKRPLGTRFKETFLSGADSKSVFEYVFMDIFVPAIKDLLVDASTQAVERAIFGESRRGRGSYRYGGPVNYSRPAAAQTRTRYDNGYSQNSSGPPWRSDSPGRDISPRARAQHDFGEIVLDNRGEAEVVLNRLDDVLEQYGMVSVADFYGLLGMSPRFTDEKWGWTDLKSARITPVRGSGFLIDLPRPVPLN